MRMDAIQVPDLRHYLFSLTARVGRDHAFEGDPRGKLVKLKSTYTVLCSLVRRLHTPHGLIHEPSQEDACAAIAPPQMPTNSVADINVVHTALGHCDEVLLRKTADQQGHSLDGPAPRVPWVFNGEGPQQRDMKR